MRFDRILDDDETVGQINAAAKEKQAQIDAKKKAHCSGCNCDNTQVISGEKNNTTQVIDKIDVSVLDCNKLDDDEINSLREYLDENIKCNKLSRAAESTRV